MKKPFIMKVAVIFFALVAATFTQGSPIVEPPLGLSYYNQPAVVVRKVTYYEPELVAVVVEKGVDDIPEESYMIQNYADVLSSDNEIHLCAADDANHCLDTPVTKLLVPSVFKSIGQSGFQDFFKHAQQVPWVSTINNNLELVRPVISPKGDLQRRRREDVAAEVVAEPGAEYEFLALPTDISSTENLLERGRLSTLKKIFDASVKIVKIINEAVQKGNKERRRRGAPSDNEFVATPGGVPSDDEILALLTGISFTEDPLQRGSISWKKILEKGVKIAEIINEAIQKGNKKRITRGAPTDNEFVATPGGVPSDHEFVAKPGADTEFKAQPTDIFSTEDFLQRRGRFPLRAILKVAGKIVEAVLDAQDQ